jgi:hypothetical protein
MALLLRAKGMTRVRPSEDGIGAWLVYKSGSHIPGGLKKKIRKIFTGTSVSLDLPANESTGAVGQVKLTGYRLSQFFLLASSFFGTPLFEVGLFAVTVDHESLKYFDWRSLFPAIVHFDGHDPLTFARLDAAPRY